MKMPNPAVTARAVLKSLLLLTLSLSASTSLAQTIELQAITDFPVIDSGEVPYYKDIAGERNVLAINAADENYREKFARADHVFSGASGVYTVTIRALGEIDGDCEYRLLVNGVLIGSMANPSVEEDYTVVDHAFEGVAIATNDVISVESNALSNGLIPEGDGFAFARGRWRTLILDQQSELTTDNANNVDLSLTVSADSTNTTLGVPVEISLVVNNAANMAVASNAAIETTLPDSLSFFSSEACLQDNQNAQLISCALPELAAGQSQNVSLSVITTVAGDSEVTFTLNADQADNNLEDNSTTMTLTAAEADISTTSGSSTGSVSTGTETNTTETGNTDNTNNESESETTSMNSTSTNAASNSGGALSLWFLLLAIWPTLRLTRLR